MLAGEAIISHKEGVLPALLPVPEPLSNTSYCHTTYLKAAEMLSSVVTPLTLIALVAAGNVVSLTCKDDKFLSCLLASPSAAVPYCRYFAHVTVTTPTVYVTSTPTM